MELGREWEAVVSKPEYRGKRQKRNTTKQAGPRPTLEELVSQIAPENLHAEVDWGPELAVKGSPGNCLRLDKLGDVVRGHRRSSFRRGRNHDHAHQNQHCSQNRARA